MNIYTVMFVVAVAVVVYFVWSQRKRQDRSEPARLPAAAPAAAAPAAAAAPGDSAPGSYDDYRRAHPSNMRQGKLTCHVCGSNLLRTESGIASCGSCKTTLYRA